MTSTVRVTHGVHRPPEQVDDLLGRAAATLSACPDDTVIGGVTAARLHGLWLPAGAPDEPIETVSHRRVRTPSSRSHSRRPELRSRRVLLAEQDIVEIDGLPVMSEARTWFALAGRLALPDLVAAGDSALRGSASVGQLSELTDRSRRCPGVVRARTALPMLDARSRSRPESHLRYIVCAAGLPKPEVNVAVFDERGEWLFEPDLSFDDVRLALEYNGALHATPKRMRADMTRTLDVADRGGWRVAAFGPTQVFRRQDPTARRVQALYRERTRPRR